MIVTQLEGLVDPDQWETLKEEFRAACRQLPAGIYQSYLIQDTADQELWRLFTVWHSREALQEYRASVDAPAGGLIFGRAGVLDPELTVFDVMEHASGD